MITALSEYFITEIDDWRSLLAYYLEEIESTEPLLKEVLSLNTVPHLAELTERHLTALLLSRQSLRGQQDRLNAMEPQLYKAQAPIDNAQLGPSVIAGMKQLRKELYTTERDYLDKKYACDDFLADTIALQNHLGNASH